MTNQIENSSLEEFKEKVAEVLELLNQSNMPIIIEDGRLNVSAVSQTAEARPKVLTGS